MCNIFVSWHIFMSQGFSRGCTTLISWQSHTRISANDALSWPFDDKWLSNIQTDILPKTLCFVSFTTHNDQTVLLLYIWFQLLLRRIVQNFGAIDPNPGYQTLTQWQKDNVVRTHIQHFSWFVAFFFSHPQLWVRVR